MKYIHKFKATLLSVALLGLTSLSYAQEAAKPAAAPASGGFTISANMAMTFTAILLLLIIMVYYGTLKHAMRVYFEKMPNGYKKNESNGSSAAKTLSVLFILMISSLGTFAQDAAAKADSMVNEISKSQNMFYLLWAVVIILELLAIFYIRKQIHFYLGLNPSKEEAKSTFLGMNWNRIWNKMNQFKPLDQEDGMDTGHNYDGIRELDNITPPWFTISFLATIVFAMIYLWRYHVAEAAPLMAEEYKIEMEEAALAKAEYLKKAGNSVDENTVKLLTSASDIAEGNKLFQTKCKACHGEFGQGGIGPNLTDDYWLHKGGIKDIFKTIKYGVVEKGMQSWKDDFSPGQIAQMASFIKSIKGTNPAGAKDKQGELYVDEGASAPSSDSGKAAAPMASTDSAKSK